MTSRGNRGAAVLVLAFLLLAALPLAGSAQGDSVILEVDPLTLVTAPGSKFVVRVMVKAGARQIDAAQLFLDFDPTYLRALSITMGTALPDRFPMPIPEIDNAAGQVNYAAGRLFGTAPSGAFELLTIEFEAQHLTIGTPLTIVQSRAVGERAMHTGATSRGESLPITLVGGNIVIATPGSNRIYLPLILRAFLGH